MVSTNTKEETGVVTPTYEFNSIVALDIDILNKLFVTVSLKTNTPELLLPVCVTIRAPFVIVNVYIVLVDES